MKLLLFALLCFAFLGCSKTPSSIGVPSSIRVQNQTERDLSKVTVGTNSFGALKSGAVSDYQVIQTVFESASVYTTETNGHFRNARFMGGKNEELASGSFTYTLTVKADNMLEVTLKRDR